MRSDKFKFIMDAMASHAIEETNSEYNASFLSMDGRHRGNSNQVPGQQKMQTNNNSTVLEVDEQSTSSRGGATKQRHQMMAELQNKRDDMDSYYDPNEEPVAEDMQSEDSFKQPQIVRKKK